MSREIFALQEESAQASTILAGNSIYGRSVSRITRYSMHYRPPTALHAANQNANGASPQRPAVSAPAESPEHTSAQPTARQKAYIFLAIAYVTVVVIAIVMIVVSKRRDESYLAAAEGIVDPQTASAVVKHLTFALLGLAGAGAGPPLIVIDSIAANQSDAPPALGIDASNASETTTYNANAKVFCPPGSDELWIALGRARPGVANFAALCVAERRLAFCQRTRGRHVNCPTELVVSFAQLAVLRDYVLNCILNCIASDKPYVEDTSKLCYVLHYRSSLLCIARETGRALTLTYRYLRLDETGTRTLINQVFPMLETG